MKLVVVGSAAVFLAVAPGAMAADLPVAAQSPIVGDVGLALAGFDWTGLYVGGHAAGVTAGDIDNTDAYVFGGGAQVGYNYQLDSFVLGAELEGTFSDNIQYTLVPGAGLSQSWTVAAKGRAGFAIDKTLVYGLGGVAVTKFDGTGATATTPDFSAGVVFGAGVEQAFNESFSIRAEYQQTRFFGVESTVGGTALSSDLTNHAFKVGGNFRF